MLTHNNLVSNVIAAAQMIQMGPTDTMLSFLPLSHSFERMAGYYTAMACGATIAYAESVDTVRDNMLEVRPTIITTVPRLFERIYSRVIKQVDAGSPLKKRSSTGGSMLVTGMRTLPGVVLSRFSFGCSEASPIFLCIPNSGSGPAAVCGSLSPAVRHW